MANPVGRPSEYQDTYPELVKNYCLLGATDKELAEFLDIAESTLNLWKTEHPEFMESIKDGREKADSLVAKSLYDKALGGDVHASKFWLINRQRAKWRDKIETGITDKEGNDIPQDPLETARKLAFILQRGVQQST